MGVFSLSLSLISHFSQLSFRRCVLASHNKNNNNVINNIEQYDSSFPGLLQEKTEIFLALNKTAAALAVVHQMLNRDSSSLFALQILCLSSLCLDPAQNNTTKEAQHRISLLVQTLEKREPNNPYLYFKVVMPLAKLASSLSSSSSSSAAASSNFVLHAFLGLLRYGLRLLPAKSEFLSDFGCFLALLGIVLEFVIYRVYW